MKETIEEAAERFYSEQSESYENAIEPTFDYSRYLVTGFIDGAKWQAESMYSEEEVELLIDFVKDCATNWDCDNDSHKYNTPCRMCEAEKVLEQFKKSKK